MFIKKKSMPDKLAKERVDIAHVDVNSRLPINSRAKEYMAQIKNPYAFRCGSVLVNLVFQPDGKPLEDAVYNYLSMVTDIENE